MPGTGSYLGPYKPLRPTQAISLTSVLILSLRLSTHLHQVLWLIFCTILPFLLYVIRCPSFELPLFDHHKLTNVLNYDATNLKRFPPSCHYLSVKFNWSPQQPLRKYSNILNLCFTLQNHVHTQRTKDKVIVAYILMITFYINDSEKKDS